MKRFAFAALALALLAVPAQAHGPRAAFFLANSQVFVQRDLGPVVVRAPRQVVLAPAREVIVRDVAPPVVNVNVNRGFFGARRFGPRVVVRP